MNSMKADGSGPGVTSLVQRSSFLRVSCSATTGKENQITYITLNISKNVSINEQVAFVHASKHGAVHEGLEDVAVHGYINNSGNPPSAYLEISYQELPYANKTFVCGCNFISDTPHKCELNERWEDAVVYVCGTDAAPDDITNIVVVEKNGKSGKNESFVGPNSTSASDVANKMQYWGDSGHERASTWVVVKRSSQMLHVITSHNPDSDSLFCRISTKTGGTEDFPMSLGFILPNSSRVKGDAEAEKSYSWLGYPFLVLILVAVIAAFIVRERNWRSRTRHHQSNTESQNRLIPDPSNGSEVSQV
ncbi:hypothetical protein C0Q70_07145 [Pomacea canaliculata]|uniref:Uncharacterized protein n=2 Tax=Pomacea canaliculata TaxID=400727 RepID=A0A2T7PE99_POMCA|nr:hypothetical protein C0Q70_07145 [Pomacea canaliculata]